MRKVIITKDIVDFVEEHKTNKTEGGYIYAEDFFLKEGDEFLATEYVKNKYGEFVRLENSDKGLLIETRFVLPDLVEELKTKNNVSDVSNNVSDVSNNSFEGFDWRSFVTETAQKVAVAAVMADSRELEDPSLFAERSVELAFDIMMDIKRKR